MKADEFLLNEGYTSDDGLGWVITQSDLIDLLEDFAESQLKEDMEELKNIRTIIGTYYPHIVDGINEHLSNLKNYDERQNRKDT